LRLSHEAFFRTDVARRKSPNRYVRAMTVVEFVAQSQFSGRHFRSLCLLKVPVNGMKQSHPMLTFCASFSFDSATPGSLPESLANWTKLEYFQGNANHFTGTLSPLFGTAWQGLKLFNLGIGFDTNGNELPGTNSIGGTLPETLASWTNLEVNKCHSFSLNAFEIENRKYLTWQCMCYRPSEFLDLQQFIHRFYPFKLRGLEESSGI